MCVLSVTVLAVIFSTDIAFAGGRHSSPKSETTATERVVSRGNLGDRRAAVHVIRSVEQLEDAPFSDALSREIASTIDFGSEAAVVFFAGTRTSGGYRLDLGDVSRTGREIVLRITQHAPAPDEIVTQALTYPHIVIGVDQPPPSIVVEGPSLR